jgi:hypothetical protein
MFNRTIKFKVLDAEISDLRVVFNIEKSLVGFPNLANIQLYNLKEDNRNKLEKSNEKIQLYAGYEDTSTPLIFDGDIVNVVNKKKGVDWISEIFAQDGASILNSATINKTLPAGTSTEQIYNELLSNMGGITKGITEGLRNCLSGKQSLLRALQLSGNVKDWLDKISKDCGFDYSVNEGVIETTPKNTPLSDESPVIINQTTGMLNSPERTEIGVNVTNLLLPALKLGRTIKIESVAQEINIGNLFFRKIPPIRNEGVYRIDKLIHLGDNRGDQWETQIQARIF